MASRSASPNAAAAPEEEDAVLLPLDERPDSPDLPLTMNASTVLLSLPRDATAALAAVPGFPKPKVGVRFKPVGNAPAFQIKGGGMQANVTSTQKFEFVVRWLRKQLRLRPEDHVFLYVNNTFAPSLDEVIGNLWMVSLLARGLMVI